MFKISCESEKGEKSGRLVLLIGVLMNGILLNDENIVLFIIDILKLHFYFGNEIKVGA